MLRRTFLPILVAAALVACKPDAIIGPPVSNGVVRVVREGNALRISNLTDQPRAYMAMDAGWLALVDLSLIALCNTADANCLRLPANGSVLVPFSEVGGYSAATKEVTVWTWRVVPSTTGGNLEPVLDETIVLKL